MPFETPSLPVLIKRAQSDLASDSLRQSDAQVLARTLGGAAYGLYGYLDWIAEQILPDKADESTLERIAALRLNQPRKAAQAATGSVSFTASAGAVLDVDTLLQSSDGRTYKVTASRTTSNGLNSTTIAALDAGSLGNADAGLTLIPVQPILGIVGSSFTVEAPGLIGGVAQESLESLRSRVISSYRIIPHGGSAQDYETWALEFPGSPVPGAAAVTWAQAPLACSSCAMTIHNRCPPPCNWLKSRPTSNRCARLPPSCTCCHRYKSQSPIN